MGTRIAILSDTLADQIAAGEVVERPASVLKELVENAIDAGATRVDVFLEKGGLDRIVVRDNGHGIHPDDLKLSLVRHATSKLRAQEELLDISTLGFRGEALASIAAVAQVRIRSREPSASVGHELASNPGQPADIQPAGMPVGTQIEVLRLFSSLPARRKFMRSEATEIGHCAETLLKVAVIHPNVHVILKHGGRELINLSSTDLSGRVTQILSRKGAGELTVIEGERSGVEVKAWFGQLDRPSRTRHPTMVIVRRRVVQERSLAQAVSQAYGDAIQGKKQPPACILVEPPPGTVDVNVHPQKAEVRFSDPQTVYAAVREVLADGLRNAPWVHTTPQATRPTTQAPAWGQTPPSRDYQSGAREAYQKWNTRTQGQVPAPTSTPAPRTTWDTTQNKSHDKEDSTQPTSPMKRGRYQLSTRATSQNYESQKNDIRRQVSSLKAASDLEPTVATEIPDPTTAAQDSYAAVPQQSSLDENWPTAQNQIFAPATTSHGDIDNRPSTDSAQPPITSLEPVKVHNDDTSPQQTNETELPNFLTCLPGLLAVFSDQGTLLTVDLRRLRAHLVYLRLAKDLSTDSSATSRIPSQSLLEPVVLRLPTPDIVLCSDAAPDLSRLGIEVEPFGDALMVRAVPGHLKNCIADADVNDLVHRVLPWLRMKRRGDVTLPLQAMAATSGADPGPRLARTWLKELLADGVQLESVPGIRRLSPSELCDRPDTN